MTPEEAKRFINHRISIGEGGLRALGLKIDCDYDSSSFAIHLHFKKVPHRDTGSVSGGLNFNETVNLYMVEHWTEKYLLHYLHRLIRDAITHELDESLLLDGKRVFDPHLGNAERQEMLAGMLRGVTLRNAP